jgi:hypothetical protein
VIPLPARHAAVLRDLQTIWTPERFIVIGAAAIACHLDFRWRTTVDLDCACAVTTGSFVAEVHRLVQQGTRSPRTLARRTPPLQALSGRVGWTPNLASSILYLT